MVELKALRTSVGNKKCKIPLMKNSLITFYSREVAFFFCYHRYCFAAKSCNLSLMAESPSKKMI